MRVLFFMRSEVYARNFESVLRLLGERGHDVHVIAQPHPDLDPTDLLGRLCKEYPGIRHSKPPHLGESRWRRFGVEVRRGLDALRYRQPEYRKAPKLRRRAELKTPAFIAGLGDGPLVGTALGRATLASALRAADRALPRDEQAEAFLRSQQPDLVIVTPLVEPGSPQSVFVRSARALGIPAALCVYSWDNLTNKGLIHDELDVITVWNQAMKREAISLHGVRPERVLVTGAPAYDHWFNWSVRQTRDVFCAQVGLNPANPYLLYLCSSRFIAPHERPYVTRWIQQIRAASPLLSDVGVLIRPHPQNADDWKDADLSGLDNVAVWPRRDGNPVDVDSRATYYDSIFHSAAVVGVNTSAQIESAIVGRGVYTLLAPEFSDTQGGTLHFEHLRGDGGVLHVAADVAAHITQLEAAIRDPGAAAQRCEQFVRAFVRPHGLDVPVAPRVVEVLETTARAGRSPAGRVWWSPLIRPLLDRAARALEVADGTSGARESGGKGTGPAERARRAKLVRSARDRVAPPPTSVPVAAINLQKDLEARFLDLRERLSRLRDARPADAAMDGEQQSIARLERLWSGGPEILGELRRLTPAIGVGADEYRESGSPMRSRMERELRHLLARGDSLWVDESTSAGGFGFRAGGRFFNEETLRFFRVISLLGDAAILRDFGPGMARQSVWEIGGGWGGFARYFKTLFPNVTYLITGRPKQLLLPAAYLITQFADARIRIYDVNCPDAFWQEWDGVDFAFAPEEVVERKRIASLALTVDIGALQWMNHERVENCVAQAHQLACRYFFSLSGVEPGDSSMSTRVRAAVEKWYWPHPLSAPAYLRKRLALNAAGEHSRDASYLLAWRRLHA